MYHHSDTKHTFGSLGLPSSATMIELYRCVFVCTNIQYIPRNMHTVFALLCFVVVIHWLIFSISIRLTSLALWQYTIAPVPAKQPWWIWINTSCEFIMNDCITTRKQSTTKPCAYFLGYTVHISLVHVCECWIICHVSILFTANSLCAVMFHSVYGLSCGRCLQHWFQVRAVF